jgi:hypothetical protein
MTSKVFSEEEAIMRAQQLELIYSQYEICTRFFETHHGQPLKKEN